MASAVPATRVCVGGGGYQDTLWYIKKKGKDLEGKKRRRKSRRNRREGKREEGKEEKVAEEREEEKKIPITR